MRKASSLRAIVLDLTAIVTILVQDTKPQLI
ncbi:hypothetical protein GLYMA_07G154150v4 [Glycine max]|nr:hypothetical protein GLYMA_07G154150v4 [Glycine max]KAH1087007.1 hypothetical protein GYH30_018504 [Glycine max]